MHKNAHKLSITSWHKKPEKIIYKHIKTFLTIHNELKQTSKLYGCNNFTIRTLSVETYKEIYPYEYNTCIITKPSYGSFDHKSDQNCFLATIEFI